MPDLHSVVIGGSNCHRGMLCPNSLHDVPPPPKRRNPPAEEGTALHAAVQMELAGMPTLGMVIPVESDDGNSYDHEITAELHEECVAPALAMARHVITLAGPGARIEVEITAPFPGVEGAFGTCDLAVITADGTLFAILDFKFGRRNAVGVLAQMRFYASAVRSRLGLAVPETGVRLFVAAPRLHHEVQELPSHRAVDMAAFEANIRNAVTPQFSEKVSAGAHCRFCPKEARCKARRDLILTGVSKPPPAPPTGEIVALAKQAQDWAKAVLDDARDHLLDGGQIDGYGLGVKYMRAWADPAQAEGMLRNRGVAPFGSDLISPAQAEKGSVPKDVVAAFVVTTDTAPSLCSLPLRGYREFKPVRTEGAAIHMPGVAK